MCNYYPQLYTEYISNFDKALQLLDESCKKHRIFGELVREFEVRSYTETTCTHYTIAILEDQNIRAVQYYHHYPIIIVMPFRVSIIIGSYDVIS